MSIWDDFVEVVSDGADAVGDLVDGAVEAGEEGLEEVGNLSSRKSLASISMRPMKARHPRGMITMRTTATRRMNCGWPRI